jgi:PKD repeat protein
MRRIHLSLFAAAALIASTACGIDKTSAPGMSGPSEFGTSLLLTASPELLPRDGVSQSLIAITVRDSTGAPLANRLIRVAASAGRLSAAETTTGSTGVATVQYTAPGVNEDVNLVTVSAAPAGNDWANSVARHVDVRIVGPSIPTPSFTWTPTAPARFALTLFDGSGTRVGGKACGASCAFTWTFSGEGTETGQTVSHRFQEEGTYPVTLTVATADGASASVTNNVTVGPGVNPTARVRFSPVSPCTNQSVFFNASESTAANGADVAEYEWDFGNGTPITRTATATTSTTYTAAGAHTVLVTVIDSNGLRATVSTNVTVRAPVAPATSCS